MHNIWFVKFIDSLYKTVQFHMVNMMVFDEFLNLNTMIILVLNTMGAI